MKSAWRVIPSSFSELNLEVTLTCAQSFSHLLSSFLNAKNNSPVEIHRQLVEVYGEKCMDIKNVRKWCREFNEGRINVHDEQRSGRPSLPESTVARIDEMVRANRRITLEEIEDGLNEDCSHFSVHKIVSETLGYRKVTARWSKLEDGTFRGVLGDGVWTLSQCPDTGNLLYTVTRTSAPQNKPAKRTRLAKVQNEDDSKLRDYFNLDVGLEQLHHNWGLEDPDYLSLSKQHSGIRILRQDPVENLFSFICSSNNNIPRITSLVEKLCTHLGPALLELDGHQFHQFPAVEALAQPDVEPLLRKLGFGYRAKYIQQSAAKICQEREPGWLMGLRDATYEEAHAALIKLPGIGAKVADCICLMSLDKWEAVPLDIHMWNLARRQYLPHLQSHKSLTDRTYREIGEFFRNKFGKHAGWAHEVLFCGELKQFKNRKAS
ncbi:OGG1 [Cordylochernes scorpioides]|uniref:DNA-(apurinic or apyrimidinic site) lyase n=1 Tax=Cordylochernes scorpioides TaxID=51811 RepID=A0ABY6K1U9_9ARAC|nr:OGG1 [Cordylochernes scorpioides]